MHPDNSPLSGMELLARNICEPSHISGVKLKKKRMYPNYKKESRDFEGRHVCRISVQRLCKAGIAGAKYWTARYLHENQTHKGYDLIPAWEVLKRGFTLEPAANHRNPYHAHIYIKELDLPFRQEEDSLATVMQSGLKRRLDDLTEACHFYTLEDLADPSAINVTPTCADCLNRNN